MKLNELFTPTGEQPERMSDQMLIAYNMIADMGWSFNVGDRKYVVYAERVIADDQENTVWSWCFGFGNIKTTLKGDGRDVSYPDYVLDNFDKPFTVFNKVIQCLNIFLHDIKPRIVDISGYSDKQNDSYIKMLKYYKKLLPKDYTISTNRLGLQLIRDDW